MKKQKNTTQSGKKTESKTKREKEKYPALNKGVNLSSRKDYIEPDYVDGVYDKDGKRVIRALNDEEKAWLNQYYEETVVTNFFHQPELKNLNKYKKAIIQDDIVQDLLKEVKELEKNKPANKKRIRELKEIIKLTKKQNEETYAKQLEHLEEELQEAREKYLLYPNKEDHKQFYNDNNSRNNCLFNRSKMMHVLDNLEIEEFDTYVYRLLEKVDIEEVMIEKIENDEISEEQTLVIDELLKEVKDHIKKKTKSSK
jgi:hypothetical protein